MAIRLTGIGHCALAARDMESMSTFYTDVLCFEVLERDPDHGGIFMNVPGTSHTIDLFPAGFMGRANSSDAPDVSDASRASPLIHIAFKVAHYQALREAHRSLVDHGVHIRAMLDHTNQRSIYFSDPEGNGLEIYFERPDWQEIFRRGRHDEDVTFSFDDPAPEWETAPE
ncbi:MAG: VOC family protein [Gammaproteobacteria bacterium]|nr:VOC family protein [Gammaproteobacteria bacterium]